MSIRVLVVAGEPPNYPIGLPDGRTGALYRLATTFADLEDALPEADVVFLLESGAILLQAGWSLAKRLRWIQAAGVGVEWALFPELVGSRVILTNCRGALDQAIAEYVLGLFLLLAKDFRGTLQAQSARVWHHRSVDSLYDAQALIIGAGSIGRRIGLFGRALGMRVTLVGRTLRADEEFGFVHAVTELSSLLPKVDYLVVAAPLTADTRLLIDQDALALLPRNARVINVGRGPIIDEVALAAALRAGKLAGAALDVFGQEPLPRDHTIWDTPNLVISPHMAGDTDGWMTRYVNLFLDNLGRWSTNAPLENIVAKDLGFIPFV
jgi:phosphoglycerate dehydrogenase-like enzyme